MATKKKDTAEKVKKNLKDLGDKVVKGSKKLYNLADLNVQKANLKQKRDEALKSLGELTFKKGKLTGKAAELGDQIKDYKAEIKKLDTQIQKEKQKKIK